MIHKAPKGALARAHIHRHTHMHTRAQAHPPDGVSIVAAHEEHWCVERRRKIERGVEVSLRRGAIAEVRHGDGIVRAGEFEAVRGTHSLRQLRGEGG